MSSSSTVDAASFEAGRHLPATCLASSAGLAWDSVLVREYLDPEETEGFTTLASPDLLVVVNLSGSFEMESRQPGGWERADYRPGSVGVTAPGRTPTLRWRRTESEQRRSLHLHLSADLLQGTADSLGRPRLFADLPDALLLDDPVIPALGGALRQALAQRASGLHADALAQALAVHVLYGRGLRGQGSAAMPATADLGSRVIPRVLEYMREHLAEEVSLDDLSREVSVSKFHLLRVFAKETGETPHRHLVGMRMRRAAELLDRTDAAVNQIAVECGYRSVGQFGRAFRRHFGASPSEYRRAR